MNNKKAASTRSRNSGGRSHATEHDQLYREHREAHLNALVKQMPLTSLVNKFANYEINISYIAL